MPRRFSPGGAVRIPARAAAGSSTRVTAAARVLGHDGACSAVGAEYSDQDPIDFGFDEGAVHRQDQESVGSVRDRSGADLHRTEHVVGETRIVDGDHPAQPRDGGAGALLLVSGDDDDPAAPGAQAVDGVAQQRAAVDLDDRLEGAGTAGKAGGQDHRFQVQAVLG